MIPSLDNVTYVEWYLRHPWPRFVIAGIVSISSARLQIQRGSDQLLSEIPRCDVRRRLWRPVDTIGARVAILGEPRLVDECRKVDHVDAGGVSLRQFVDEGRNIPRIAVGAEVVGAQRVEGDENDVVVGERSRRGAVPGTRSRRSTSSRPRR